MRHSFLAALAVPLWRRRRRECLWLAAGAALLIAPWMLRNLVWTGNPVAPLFNSWFPNPYFHAATERHLAASLRTYGGVEAANLLVELAIRGQKLQGLIGPVFLLGPLALLALRRRAGRIVLAAGAVVAVPWLFNIGARFLMPALAFVSLALAMALPRRLSVVAAGLQALFCLPAVVAQYADPHAWTLKGLPWRAALRLQSEPDYLRQHLWQYRVAELVQKSVPAGTPIFDLTGAASAYFDAVAVGPWQSAAGERMVDALRAGAAGRREPLTKLSATWPRQPLQAVRIRLAHPRDRSWSVQEVELSDGTDNIAVDPQWRVSAGTNIWEAPLAFDGNLTTRWSTRTSADGRPYLELRLNEPKTLTRATLFTLGADARFDVEFFGQAPDGAWRLLSTELSVVPWPRLNLRRSAAQALAHEGIRYILGPVVSLEFAPLGKDLAEHASDWGLDVVGVAHGVCLLRLREDIFQRPGRLQSFFSLSENDSRTFRTLGRALTTTYGCIGFRLTKSWW